MENEYDQSFIKQQVDLVISKLKEYDNHGSLKKPKNDAPDFPEYFEGYNDIVKNYRAILSHAEKNYFPGHLFLKRSPNQTEEEFQYIKENYKQITLPVFIDHVNSVNKCFNDGNYSIDYVDESQLATEYKGENSFRNYVENEIEIYGSIENFMKSLFTSIKSKDANGVIAVYPKDIPLGIADESPAYIESENEMREPIPVYFTCEQVVQFDEDDWYLIETYEKSKVSIGNQMKNIGRIYMFFDGVNIWKIIQTGKYVDYTFTYMKYMSHGIGEVPVKKNNGVPRLICGKPFYDSPFAFATDLLDLVALNANYLQVSISTCVYPQRVMLGDECDFTDSITGATCFEGTIIDPQDRNAKRKCPVCSGTGLKTRLGPLGTMLLKPSDQNIKASDAIYFASPSTETLEFIEKKIENDEIRARNILHLYSTDQKVQGKETTATESNIDQKAHYSFIKPISDQIFDMYGFILNTIGKMREGEQFKAPTVISPLTFDFYTEKDYLEQLKTANEAGMPPYVIYTIMYAFLNTMYYNERQTSRIFQIIMDADRLVTLKQSDVDMGVLRGTVEPYEKILHESAITFINQLLTEDPKYLDKELKDQVNLLVEKAKTRANEIEANRPDPADITAFGNGTQ